MSGYGNWLISETNYFILKSELWFSWCNLLRVALELQVLCLCLIGLFARASISLLKLLASGVGGDFGWKFDHQKALALLWARTGCN